MENYIQSVCQDFGRSNCQNKLRELPIYPVTYAVAKVILFHKTVDPTGADMPTMIATLRANLQTIMASLRWGWGSGQNSYYYDFDTHSSFAIGNGTIGIDPSNTLWYPISGVSGYLCVPSSGSGNFLDTLGSSCDGICWVIWRLIISDAPGKYIAYPYPTDGDPYVSYWDSYLSNDNPYLPIPAKMYITRSGGSASLQNQFELTHGVDYPFYPADDSMLAEVQAQIPPNDVDGAPPAGAAYFPADIPNYLGVSNIHYLTGNYPGIEGVYEFAQEGFTWRYDGIPDTGGAGGTGGGGSGTASQDGAGDSGSGAGGGGDSGL